MGRTPIDLTPISLICIFFPPTTPLDPDLDIEVNNDETHTNGSKGEELKVAGDSHGTGKK